jgi:hypothetical protein
VPRKPRLVGGELDIGKISGFENPELFVLSTFAWAILHLKIPRYALFLTKHAHID